MIPTPFGLALKDVRVRRRLSQSKLAEILHCDHSHISRIEHGSRFPSRAFADRIVAALHLTPPEAAELLLAGGWVVDPIHARVAADPLLLALGALLWDERLPHETFAQLRATLAFLVDAAKRSLSTEAQP